MKSTYIQVHLNELFNAHHIIPKEVENNNLRRIAKVHVECNEIDSSTFLHVTKLMEYQLSQVIDLS